MKFESFFWKALCGAIALVIIASIVFTLILPSYNKLFPNSDFEFGTLENWEPLGKAFQTQPTFGDNPVYRHRSPVLHEGKYWIGTFENRPTQDAPAGNAQGDPPIGALLSMEFTIKKPQITFLLGGGDFTPLTSVYLEIGGRPVLIAIGDAKKTQTETMKRIVWDVTPWLNQKARIRIRDHGVGDWGHINVDDFTY